MSEPIKVGDLVMVVRLLPCGHGRYSMTFRVSSFDRRNILNSCHYCGFKYGPFDQAIDKTDGLGVELYRLRKIDPPAEQETTETHEELTA